MHFETTSKNSRSFESILEIIWLLEDVYQLLNPNGTNGNQMNNSDFIYKMWVNHEKTAAKKVSHILDQVSFLKDNEVRKMRVENHIIDISNWLDKSEREKRRDFRAELKSAMPTRGRERSARLGRVVGLKRNRKLTKVKAGVSRKDVRIAHDEIL